MSDFSKDNPPSYEKKPLQQLNDWLYLRAIFRESPQKSVQVYFRANPRAIKLIEAGMRNELERERVAPQYFMKASYYAAILPETEKQKLRGVLHKVEISNPSQNPEELTIMVISEAHQKQLGRAQAQFSRDEKTIKIEVKHEGISAPYDNPKNFDTFIELLAEYISIIDTPL